MRKIKFRAWIIDEDKMVYPTIGEHFISLDGSYYAIIYNMANPEKKILSKEKDDNIKLMQFTGLHDKNGQEIFEGDILKCGDFTGYIYYEPKGCEYMWKYICSKTYFDATFHDAGYRSEIIGNIHDNPELLKSR